MWPKLKSSLAKAKTWNMSKGTLPRQSLDYVRNDINVNEEYMEAFRTESYTEIWSKIHNQISRINEEHLSLSPFAPYLHISDYLLEPRQEIISKMIDNSSDLHSLLLEYFQGSLEACKTCCFLLQCVHQTRANYRIIQGVLDLTQRVAGDYTKEQYQFIYAQFGLFISLENPLSGSNPMNFHQIHEIYSSMLQHLKIRQKKIMGKAKVAGFCKKAIGIGLVIACGALAIAALLLTASTFMGLLATPIVMCFSTPLLKWKFRSIYQLKRRSHARLRDQLDSAAKGAYILNRDFDTMSRLVTRLGDEIEHSKTVIKICLRNAKGHLLEEMMKELQNNEAGFLEKLEELEEHLYLCFVTINRARKLVIKEIDHQQHSR